MQNIVEWLQTIYNQNMETPNRLIISLLIIFILWLLNLLITQIINRRVEDVGRGYRLRKALSFIIVSAGVVLIGPLWFSEMQSLATFLGLVTAGLAIALHGPISNLAGWIFIIWRRPFEVGDRIEIGPDAGDVIDIRFFQFTLLEIGNWVAADQSTGRVVHVPNGKVFSDVLANYSKGFEYIWNEIPVLVTFESDWQKTKVILQEIADGQVAHVSESAAEHVRQAARRFMIYYPTLTPTVYTRVEASGVLLTIRYLCKPRNRRGTEQAIWEDILRAFAQHADIEFAYPTQRFYRYDSQVPPGQTIANELP